jgi:hypothetical protein
MAKVEARTPEKTKPQQAARNVRVIMDPHENLVDFS